MFVYCAINLIYFPNCIDKYYKEMKFFARKKRDSNAFCKTEGKENYTTYMHS